MKIMVAYDGSLQAKEALVYGMEKAREKGGEVFALHVFNSPLFLDYDVMDAEAASMRESARLMDEAAVLIRERGNGVNAGLFRTEGNPEEEVINFAREKKVDVLLCPSSFKGIIGKYQRAIGADLRGAEKTSLAVLTTKMIDTGN